MNTALANLAKVPAMTDREIDVVRSMETEALKLPQVVIPTHHVLHAGLYARTIMIPKDIVLTGALIKRATTLIISGEIVAYIGAETIRISGYEVIPASANRKQAFMAIEDTHMTMIFATTAKTVEEAETQFTDEADLLFSRLPDSINHIIITGEDA